MFSSVLIHVQIGREARCAGKASDETGDLHKMSTFAYILDRSEASADTRHCDSEQSEAFIS